MQCCELVHVQLLKNLLSVRTTDLLVELASGLKLMLSNLICGDQNKESLHALKITVLVLPGVLLGFS